MKKKSLSVVLLSLLLAVLLLAGGCGTEQKPTATTTKPVTTQPAKPSLTDFINAEHGSAVTPEGKILLISIFTNDLRTAWNPKNEEDAALKKTTLTNLGIAADYLSAQVRRYGKELSFVYDWKQDNQLLYEATFDENLVRMDGGTYSLQNDWLVENIDTRHLLEKYKADGVIFIFFLNTDYENSCSPWSLGHANGDYILLEFSNFFLKYNDMDVPPATYAHEILHAFGAHDLYYKNEFCPQAYVDHLKQTGSNDIMFTVASGDKITNEISPVDAYFIGIGSRPAEADEWKLGMSEHM